MVIILISLLILPSVFGIVRNNKTERIDVESIQDVGDFSFSSRNATEGDSWTMFGYDHKNTHNYPHIAPNGSTTVWESNFDSRFFSSPCVVDGKIYVGGDDFKLYCVDAGTGQVLFDHFFPSQVTASPCVVGDIVYVACKDHKLYAFNTTREDVDWTYEASGSLESSPIVRDGAVYFSSFDGNIYAVDTYTHQLIWRYECEDDYNITTTAAIQGGNVLFTISDVKNTRSKLVCLDVNGFSDQNDGFTGESDTSPDAGDLVWEYEMPDTSDSSPSIMSGNVYVGCDDQKVYCIDIADGSYIWDSATDDSVKACPTPVLSTNTVIFGSRDGYVYSVDASNGALKWKALIGDSIISPATVADGKVYVGSLDYNLYCFDLAGNLDTTTDQIFSAYMGDSMWCRAAPVIHGGMLYQACMDGSVANSGKIVALGSPDVGIYNILLSDDHPFHGEVVDINVYVKNNRTVTCQADVECWYASGDNSIKVLIDTVHVNSPPRSLKVVTAEWTAKQGIWYIWIKLTNVTPLESAADQFNNTNTPGEISVSPVPSTEWNMFMRDTAHSSHSSIPVNAGRIEWSSSPGGHLYQPVISKGYLVVAGKDGTVSALDQYSGDIAWQRELDATALSNPTIHNDKIFVPYEGFRIRSIALVGGPQQNPGKVLWTKSYPEISSPVTPIMAHNGILVVPTTGGNVYAIDEDDGTMIWSWNLSIDISTVPLILGNEICVLSNNGDVFLLDIYSGDYTGGISLNLTSPLTPTYYGSKIYIPTENGKLYSYYPLLNTSDSSVDLEVNITTPLVKAGEKDIKVVGTENSIRILDSTFNTIGEVELGGVILQPPVGTDERCYVIDQNGVLYSINTSVGGIGDREMWNLSLTSTPSGSPVLWQGKLYLTTPDGEVLSIGARNSDPLAELDKPDDGDMFRVVDEIDFSALSSSDPDGDSLQFKWESSLDGLLFLGDSPTYKTNLTPGLHLITLTVDDQKGGRATLTFQITVLGKEVTQTYLPDLEVGLRIQHIGSGVMTAAVDDEKQGISAASEWKVVNITTTYNWFSWLELRFELHGTPLIPNNANLSSLNLYYLDKGTGNWTVYQNAVLSLSGGFILVNLTQVEFPLYVTVYGKINVNETPNGSDHDDPVAIAGLDATVKEDGTVDFDASGSSADGVNISTYVWTFDYDGEKVTLYGRTVDYTFKISGEYEVTLNVTDEDGKWDTDELLVTVLKKDDGGSGSGGGTWFYIFLIVLIILVLLVLIFREYRKRSEQKKMDDDFFQEEEN